MLGSPHYPTLSVGIFTVDLLGLVVALPIRLVGCPFAQVKTDGNVLVAQAQTSFTGPPPFSAHLVTIAFFFPDHPCSFADDVHCPPLDPLRGPPQCRMSLELFDLSPFANCDFATRRGPDTALFCISRGRYPLVLDEFPHYFSSSPTLFEPMSSFSPAPCGQWSFKR